jgi:hypothetical protein
MLYDWMSAKYGSAEAWLDSYSGMYWYPIDFYAVDETVDLRPAQSDLYSFYLDRVVNYFQSLPKVTLPARIIGNTTDTEPDDLGYIFRHSFIVVVPDIALRKNRVSLRVGDVVTTAGLFGEMADLKDFSQYTKPAFVRLIQRISPQSYALVYHHTLEWGLEVSDTDVIFRTYA